MKILRNLLLCCFLPLCGEFNSNTGNKKGSLRSRRTVRRYVGNDGQITATHCDVEVIVSALAAQIIKKLAEKAIEKAGAEILGSGLGNHVRCPYQIE